jgi:fission process protein 1
MAADGVSFSSLGDVGYAGYRAHLDRQLPSDTTNMSPAQKVELRKRQVELAKGDQDANKTSESTHVGLIMARRAVFQSIASMALPAFTIHSVSESYYTFSLRGLIHHRQIVRYSAPLFAKSSRPRVRASGPTVAGLAFVPALVSVIFQY